VTSLDPQAVYELVQQIPPGRVMTYGYIARIVGCNNPRLIGRILHNNPDPATTPCHRVVTSRGQMATNFAFGGINGHTERLQAEGVIIKNGKLNLFQYLWLP
jgi:methylated-DNA-protein-cysteine methyltransferase-like protein